MILGQGSSNESLETTRAVGVATTQETLEYTPKDPKTPPVFSPPPITTPAEAPGLSGQAPQDAVNQVTPPAPVESLETGHGGEAARGNQPSPSQVLAAEAEATKLGVPSPKGPLDWMNPHPPQKRDTKQVPQDPTHTPPVDTSIYDKGVYWKNLCKNSFISFTEFSFPPSSIVNLL